LSYRGTCRLLWTAALMSRSQNTILNQSFILVNQEICGRELIKL